jgi:hypothetical protein
MCPELNIKLIKPVFSIPVAQQPVGGRLQEYWQNWQMICTDGWIVQFLREGYRLELDSRPPLRQIPVESKLPVEKDKRQAMLDLVDAQLEKHILEVVLDDSPGFYSRFFVFPKRESKKWRGILDLS